MPPLVSVLLPSLNHRRFLDERVESIFSQTLTDWELIILDGYSEDGSWEFLRELPHKDARIRAGQAPREGIYPAWNKCLQAASGRFVYIATSDDTMPPDCLEKLVAGLEEHPDCDLAHCPLRVIDESGRESADWWRHGIFARSSGTLLGRKHIRRAPLDGLLHLSGENVYVSITQMLIRRSLFDRVGQFESRWGSEGDFNWHMRAALLANTVHIADTWGGWRQHSGQATAGVNLFSANRFRNVNDMIDDALRRSEPLLADAVQRRLAGWARAAKESRCLDFEVRERTDLLRRRLFLLGRLACGSASARIYMSRWIRHLPQWPETAHEIIGRWLRNAGLGALLEPLEPGSSCASSPGQAEPPLESEVQTSSVEL
jgi:glycosyltransferase involved in cell wall biosynthesis